MDTRQQKNPEASTDEWYTPRWIIDLLGPFDTDPCSPVVQPYEIAPISYNEEQDGLTHDWQGVVWMNPPYSRKPLRQFCEKMARHGNGLALLMNRQDNLLWQEVIFPSARSMLFMRHRVKFLRPDGTTGSPFFGSASWRGATSATADCDRAVSRENMLY